MTHVTHITGQLGSITIPPHPRPGKLYALC